MQKPGCLVVELINQAYRYKTKNKLPKNWETMWGYIADLESKIRVELSFWTVATPGVSHLISIFESSPWNHIPLLGSNVIVVWLNLGFNIIKKLPQVTLMCSQDREPWATESLCGKDRMWTDRKALRSGWVYRGTPGGLTVGKVNVWT